MGAFVTDTKTALFPVGFKFRVDDSNIIGTVISKPYEVEYFGIRTAYTVEWHGGSCMTTCTVFEKTIVDNLQYGAYSAL